jgi:hypothetical protein
MARLNFHLSDYLNSKLVVIMKDYGLNMVDLLIKILAFFLYCLEEENKGYAIVLVNLESGKEKEISLKGLLKKR